jgi:hypothetical protein
MRIFAHEMERAQALTQLKAFARQDGAILGLVWILSFAATILSPQTPFGNLLALATPVIVGWRLCKFRDGALERQISFRRGFAYSVYTFFYASILFALAQYIYFRYIDNGMLVTMFQQTEKMMETAFKSQQKSMTEIKEAADMMRSYSPIQLTFLFLMQNLFIGLILSFPIAAVCKRVKQQ